jgi:UDP-galactopyranose mutase
MVRHARRRRVLFVEEARFDVERKQPHLDLCGDGVRVAVPSLPADISPVDAIEEQRLLIADLLHREGFFEPVLYYYTPMALSFTDHLQARLIVYDCMDELSLFRNADPAIVDMEARLLRRADVVFTGGWSLYEQKRNRHANVKAMPSSVEVAHFAQARTAMPEPFDQARIPRPRLGFFGVIDERLDIELVAGLADARPDWSIVLLGPVVKIHQDELPRRDNIHYLGGKDYSQLPSYLSGWDVALLPFARNESTRFISPTKTPEYLAAGRPVVSTSIRDVVRPYGNMGLVRIANNVEQTIGAVEAALDEPSDPTWLARVDKFLAATSWDLTWAKMEAAMEEAARRKSCSGR